MKSLALYCSMLVACSVLELTSAFVVAVVEPLRSSNRPACSVSGAPRAAWARLAAAEGNQKKKGGALDESVRTKLLSESIAPWRTLRLFLYFSLGSGAFIGGLVTLPGAAAVLSGAKEGDMNVEVRRLDEPRLATAMLFRTSTFSLNDSSACRSVSESRH